MRPISSIFDIAMYCLMYFFFQCMVPEDQSLFQSGWFIEGLLSQTLIVHIIRTRKIPFIQSRASWPVMIMTFGIMAIGICVPFTSFGASIGLMPLPWIYFPWLVGVLLTYCILTQYIKQWYIRRFLLDNRHRRKRRFPPSHPSPGSLNYRPDNLGSLEQIR